ncbi:MAG: hypothetical protein AB2693_27710, partial [Candidatus Thiodiazotropha sp.]
MVVYRNSIDNGTLDLSVELYYQSNYHYLPNKMLETEKHTDCYSQIAIQNHVHIYLLFQKLFLNLYSCIAVNREIPQFQLLVR